MEIDAHKPLGVRWNAIYGVGLAVTTAISVLAAVAADRSEETTTFRPACTRIIDAETTLTLDRLQALHGSEDPDATTVRQQLGSPYCLLPKVALRDGVLTERELYRTTEGAFAVVAYEGDRYIGYSLEASDRPGVRWMPDPPTFETPIVSEVTVASDVSIAAGDEIAERRVVAAFGELSLRTSGKVFAPFDGWANGQLVFVTDGTLRSMPSDCTVFSSPQIPNYLLRLCGLGRRHLGYRRLGEALGRADGYLHVTLLTYRTEESGDLWVYVPPAASLVQHLFDPYPSHATRRP
ncbi:hypothetical protein [Baaleninema simplex]|uniref:hypothetical protein n=1 Tax=Baaleninema simplex TaxID=2862350 RepID=UPI00034D09F8|nr:hypothetical protein [Baaleninema simplex]